jgi:hypothetical protein
VATEHFYMGIICASGEVDIFDFTAKYFQQLRSLRTFRRCTSARTAQFYDAQFRRIAHQCSLGVSRSRTRRAHRVRAVFGRCDATCSPVGSRRTMRFNRIRKRATSHRPHCAKFHHWAFGTGIPDGFFWRGAQIFLVRSMPSVGDAASKTQGPLIAW